MRRIYYGIIYSYLFDEGLADYAMNARRVTRISAFRERWLCILETPIQLLPHNMGHPVTLGGRKIVRKLLQNFRRGF
jgi:hypothetical protein